MTFYTVSIVAEQLGIDAGKVLAWIHSGALTAVDVSENCGGRPRWRISQEALDAFLRQRSTAPATTRTRRKKAEPQKYYA